MRGLRANRRDFDILVKHLQPEVICLQETKLVKNPQKAHFQCANYDCYYKSRQRRDDQLPCGGVSIYIKKGIFHRPVQLNTHLQAVAVEVTLQGAPVTIFSIYAPTHDHLSVRDLTNLIKNRNGQIIITGDFNGHNHLWGSPHDDTRGQVIERFTNLHDLCILNDGTHTYLKPQAQHVNSPTSAIDLTMCTPGVALRCNWEVIPDSHGSDHYPVLTSVSPTSADANQGVHDPTHWVFSRADWEGFMGVCQERIDDAVLQSPDPLQSFVDLVIKIADDFIPKASTIPRKSNPWFDQECRDALKTRRALDNKVKRGCGPHQETLISFKRAQARARRLFNQKKRDSWRNYVSQLTTNTPIKHVWDRVRKISGKNICPPKQYLRGKDGKAVTTPRDVANEHAAAFAGNSSSAHYSQEFLQIKEEAEKENLNF